VTMARGGTSERPRRRISERAEVADTLVDQLNSGPVAG
jgi:hypothetical protein